MRKLLLLLIIIGLLPLTLSAGDNWVIHASDGVSKINGTDVCVDIYGSQKCLSETGTGGGDIAGVIAGDGLTGGGLSGEVTLDVFADTCGAGNFSSYNGTGFECDTPAGGTVYNDLFNFTNGPGYYNSTNFDIADYYLLNNPFGYYNSTNPSPDTTYDAGSNLTLTSTTFSLNTAGVLEWLKNIFWDISTALFTDQNITTTGNITASYFFGDGSELTNLPAGTEVDPKWTSNQTAFNDTWNAYVNENSSITHIGDCPSGQFAQNLTKDGPECAAPSGSGDITAVTTDGPYLTGGTENGDADLLIDTGALNDTIFANSLNQTEADAIYITLATEGDLNVNSSNYWDNYNTANTTWFENIAGVLSLKLSELTSWVNTWLGTKTTDDLTEGTTNLYDNSTWNETRANALYADISVTGGNSSWNETHADTLYAGIEWGYNQTVPANAYTDSVNVSMGEYVDGKFIPITDLPLANLTTPHCSNITGATSDLCILTDTNTEYTAGSNLSLVGGEFSLDTVGILAWLDTIYQAIGTYLTVAVEYIESGDDYIVVNDSTGNVEVTLDETKLNETIELLDTDTTYTNGSAINLTNTEFSLSLCEDNEIWKMDGSAWNCEADATGGAEGAFTNITNFTGTLTNDKICIYDSSQQIINCTYTDQTGDGGNVKAGDGTYTYNDTTIIYFNHTLAGTNLSVNSSDYWDSYDTANTTWFEDIAGALSLKLSELTSWVDTWIGTKTTDDLAQGSTNLYDNRSWNQTFADTLYADISVTGDDASWNKTYADTLYAILGYGDDWNKTYADTIYQPIGTYLTSSEILAQFGNFSAWDYFTGIPTATPSDGDTTHLSTADQIYDWIIGLGYSTTDGTVTSVSAGDGLDFTSITSTGSVTLGTPSTLTSSTTNAVTTTSHTHEVDESGFSIGASQITAGTFGTGNYVMDTNLTVERVVFENNAQHYINDSADCIIIVGSTSVLEVC